MKAFKSFNKRFTKKNLKSTYKEKTIDSGAIGIDKINHNNFDENLAENINTVKRKVKNNTYKFTVYKQKLISKGPDSKPRTISIPTIRDRLTLRCMCDMLFDIYSEEINLNIPQVTINKVQLEMNKGIYDAFVKIDIKSFYNSIPHDKLKESLKKKIRKKEILNLIYKAITNGTTSTPKKVKHIKII